MKDNPFTLHIIKNAEGIEPLKAILPTDGTRGLVIGEDWEVRALYETLGAYLTDSAHQGEISEFHEQLGSQWVNVGEAAAYARIAGEDIPERTIRWAASHEFIKLAQKQGRDWRFPRNSLVAWMKNRPNPGPKVA
jgi:hypothetical protein